MTWDERFFEHEHLVKESYPDSSKLDARRRIYRFSRSELSLPEWIEQHLDGPLGKLLDVGCGPGLYTRKFAPRAETAIGMDLSPGMAREAKESGGVALVADAEHLPFHSGTFDTTLCLHMLYHVADIPRAVAELRRVTRQGGRVAVVTLGNEHMGEMRDLFDSVVEEKSGIAADSVLSGPRRFRLEDAAGYLQASFDELTRFDMKSELRVTEVEAIDGYLESIRGFHEPKLPPTLSWDSITAEALERVRTAIQREGAFRITAYPGMFICK